MATRTEVENLITTNVDSGRPSTAVEVQEVLMALLDYTENKESETVLKPFHFNNNRKLANEGSGRADLLYSFNGLQRDSENGFVGHSVNFAFNFIANSGHNGNLSFKLEEKLIPFLKDLMVGENMAFIVPLLRTPESAEEMHLSNTFDYTWLNLRLKGNNLHMIFPSAKMNKGDTIVTAIQFHIPEGY